jgi:hypothetical protein
MKFILLLVLAWVFFACSTEVQLEGPGKDIPVLYAFINKQDTAHYIRLERAFQTSGANAEQIAQNPDSLYYKNAIVELEKLPSTQRFRLIRVDAAKEGYPRQDGPFAKTPNYLYKIKANQLALRGNEELRIIINRGEGKPLISAQTTVVADLGNPDRPSSPVAMVDYNRNITFGWQAPLSARVFDLRLRIRYRESITSTTFVNKTLEWVMAEDFQRPDESERVTYNITGEQFYKYLAGNIEVDPGKKRIFDGFDLQITAGGKEMIDFLRISRANTGITSSQVVPIYTNVPNGLGVFTSRNSVLRNNLQLSTPSYDSLRLGKFTKRLNFQ